jgi:hypothetical protein
MSRTLCLVLLVLGVGAGSAAAEVFRCVEADGGIRFVDSPELCDRAEPHTTKGRVELAPDGEAPPAARAPATGAAPVPPLRLEEVWPARGVGDGWEVLDEAPGDPASDSDLVRWGVRAQRTRHYTRYRGARVEVCSVEIWEFASDLHARTARAGFAYPGWEFAREGSLLLMLRGRRWTLGQRSHSGVFPACRRIGKRVRARAARLTAE